MEKYAVERRKIADLLAVVTTIALESEWAPDESRIIDCDLNERLKSLFADLATHLFTSPYEWDDYDYLIHAATQDNSYVNVVAVNQWALKFCDHKKCIAECEDLLNGKSM